MKTGIITVIAGICLLATAVQAQDSTAQPLPQQWSLQDCINYASQHNISINTLQQPPLISL